MSGADWLALGGIFLGGAFPWLEAIVVIPAGILAGLPVVPVVLAGVIGNLTTVAMAAWLGERVRTWWADRRRARLTASGHESEWSEDRSARRRAKIDRIMRRWGLPALAVLGPVGLGTQVSAMVAVGTGVRASVTFAWISAGTVAWSIVAAGAAVTGLNIAGV